MLLSPSMASGPMPAENKSPVETSSDNEAAAREEGLQPPHVEYDIERVEAVYKKLDLRIIPGKTSDHVQYPRPCLY